jgi:hypothetical protein
MSGKRDAGVFDTLRLRWLNLYPPFPGAGIRILRRESGKYTVKVRR